MKDLEYLLEVRESNKVKYINLKNNWVSIKELDNEIKELIEKIKDK